MQLLDNPQNDGATLLAERSLHEFTRQAWHVIESAPFVDNWHIGMIAESLEAVSYKQIEKLFIMVPPRHMKSLMVSVFWPAWEWIHRPQHSFFTASHSFQFASRDNYKCRQIIASDWYQSRWGDKFNIDARQDSKWFYQNDSHGFKKVAGLNSSVVGEGAHIRVIDDLLDPKKSTSKAAINQAKNFYLDSFYNRYLDPSDARLVAIAQRVCEDDPMGMLMERYPSADIICLPARFELDHPTPNRSSIGLSDPRTGEGELLFKDRFTEDVQSVIDNDSDYKVSAQQQQRPQPASGGILKPNWWQYYTELPRIVRRVIYVDTANKIKEKNDYTVFAAWGLGKDGNIYLLDLVQDKVEFNDLKILARTFWAKHRVALPNIPACNVMKIEDKASGTQLVQELRREDNINIDPVPRDTNLIQRAVDLVFKIKDGHVFLPSIETELTDLSFMLEFIREHSGLRLDNTHKHDDMASTTFDAINDLLLEAKPKKKKESKPVPMGLYY